MGKGLTSFQKNYKNPSDDWSKWTKRDLQTINLQILSLFKRFLQNLQAISTRFLWSENILRATVEAVRGKQLSLDPPNLILPLDVLAFLLLNDSTFPFVGFYWKSQGPLTETQITCDSVSALIWDNILCDLFFWLEEMINTPEVLYQKRIKHVQDAIGLREPDRVPILSYSDFPLLNIPEGKAVYWFEKTACLRP